MNEDNKKRRQNGVDNNENVLQIIKKMLDEGTISGCKYSYRIGYPGMANQFFAPYCIEFKNGNMWILAPTTSVRADRHEIQQWRAFHIKKLNKNVVKALIIVSDAVLNNKKELLNYDNYYKRIHSGEFITAIDDIIFCKDLEEQCKLYQDSLTYNEDVQ